jgi:PAS domain-containing protein
MLICAWCGTEIKATHDDHSDAQNSHGICQCCADTVFYHRGLSLQSYIDSIPLPVLVVDNNTGVIGANSKACEMLHMKPERLIDRAIGPVFDCTHARRPQGCGRNIHCSGCVIRNCVLTTFNTGEPQISVPATLTSESVDRLSEVVLTVTTVKTSDYVVLRLDQVLRPSS